MLRPTSASEFDQITRRLARSARTYRTDMMSANYLELALKPLTQLGTE